MNPDLAPGALQKKGMPKKGARGFQEVSPERRGYWHGVMTAKLIAQEARDDFYGFYRCECRQSGCEASIEGFDEAREFFVPGHVVARADKTWKGHRGFKFGGRSLGPDDPDNIVPVSPDCNEREFWERVS